MIIHKPEFNSLIMILSLPLCIGMICAFLAGKKEVRARPVSLSRDLWHGYLVGNGGCVISSFVVMFLVLLVKLDRSTGEAFLQTFIVIFFVGVASLIIGFIIYMPCAFLGYNLKARRRAEAEIAITQRQILKDIQAEKSTEND